MGTDDAPLVPIASFATAFDAHLARGLLESEGLRVVVIDEHLVSANAALAYAVGGVKLLVRAPHAQRALAILAARQRGEYRIDAQDDPS